MDTYDFLLKKYNIEEPDRELRAHIYCDRRTDLPLLFKELGFKVGAEIGVLGGEYSEILCQSNPDLILYSIDAWSFYLIHKNFRKQNDYDKLYLKAVSRLSKYPNNKIIRKWSMDAVKDFKDESLDFVWIDANHEFQYIVNDIAEWSKKVRKGGIVAGHDYGDSKRSQFCHVKTVVDTWATARGIKPLFILEAPTLRREVSWMWVKE